MASKLSSILVKLGLIPIRKLDQAFQNQVIHGGTLDSALLELGLIKEKDLIRVLTEASELPSIQLADMEVGDSKQLVSVFPQKLALRYQVIPIIRREDRVGVLVNAEFDRNKIEEIGFMLGVTLCARVVPEPRLLHFASLIYGFEIDDRQKRILAKLGDLSAYPENHCKAWDLVQAPEAFSMGEASEPVENQPAPVDVVPDRDSTPVPEFSYVERTVPTEILVPTIRNEHITGEHARLLRSELEPQIPPELKTEVIEDDEMQEAVTRPGFTFPEKKQHKSPFSDSGAIGPLPDHLPGKFPDTGSFPVQEKPGQIQAEMEPFLTEPMGSPEIPAHADNEVPETSETEPAITEEKETSTKEVPIAEPDGEPQDSGPTVMMQRSVEPREGTHEKLVSFDGSAVSLAEFTEMLATATSRDEVLIAFLRYCSMYAQYLFLFTVENDAACGRFAIYRGQVDQHRVRNYLISLDFDSVLQKAWQKIPTFGAYQPSEGNQFLLDHLSLSAPNHIMALPVLVGSRTVALVLGTHNLVQAPTAMGELLSASGLLSQALSRLIKQKKIARLTGLQKGMPTQSNIEASPGQPQNIATAVTVPIPARLQQEQTNVEEIIALIDQLEHLSIQQDSLDVHSAQALRNFGDQTLEVLHFQFPGIITYREMEDPMRSPPPSEHGPLLRFIVEWGLPVVSVLMDLLDSDNPQVRFYATYLFAEIRFPDILFRIAEKLFDPEPSVREIGAKVILSYEGHREYGEITSNLRGYLSHPDTNMQLNTIEALGRLRDKFSIEPMLALLPGAPAPVGRNLTLALKLITLRDFGNHTDRWQSWWVLNSPRHRILWLIEALRHSDVDLRTDAIFELKRIVGDSFGYHPEASPEDRESSVRKWVNWWDTKGRNQLS